MPEEEEYCSWSPETCDAPSLLLPLRASPRAPPMLLFVTAAASRAAATARLDPKSAASPTVPSARTAVVVEEAATAATANSAATGRLGRRPRLGSRRRCRSGCTGAGSLSILRTRRKSCRSRPASCNPGREKSIGSVIAPLCSIGTGKRVLHTMWGLCESSATCNYPGAEHNKQEW